MDPNDPYVWLPRELWDNVVVFSGIVNADVYAVLYNAIRGHLKMHSEKWTQEQKDRFAELLQLRKKDRGECDADVG